MCLFAFLLKESPREDVVGLGQGAEGADRKRKIESEKEMEKLSGVGRPDGLDEYIQNLGPMERYNTILSLYRTLENRRI